MADNTGCDALKYLPTFIAGRRGREFMKNTENYHESDRKIDAFRIYFHRQTARSINLEPRV